MGARREKVASVRVPVPDLPEVRLGRVQTDPAGGHPEIDLEPGAQREPGGDRHGVRVAQKVHALLSLTTTGDIAPNWPVGFLSGLGGYLHLPRSRPPHGTRRARGPPRSALRPLRPPPDHPTRHRATPPANANRT